MLVPVSPSGTGYTLRRLRPCACSRTVSRNVVIDSRSAAVFNRSRVGTTEEFTSRRTGLPRPVELVVESGIELWISVAAAMCLGSISWLSRQAETSRVCKRVG